MGLEIDFGAEFLLTLSTYVLLEGGKKKVTPLAGPGGSSSCFSNSS